MKNVRLTYIRSLDLVYSCFECRFNVSLLFHIFLLLFLFDVCALNASDVAVMLDACIFVVMIFFLSAFRYLVTIKYSHITRSSIVLW